VRQSKRCKRVAIVSPSLCLPYYNVVEKKKDVADVSSSGQKKKLGEGQTIIHVIEGLANEV